MPITNFTVNFDLLASNPDDHTGDGDPAALTGTVTFTPVLTDNRPALAPTYSPRPSGLKLRTFTGYVDTDGRLKTEKGGTVGVRLWANDPVLNLQQLWYQVDFNVVSLTGEPVYVQGGYFQAPTTDTTVNLASSLQQVGTGALGITQGVQGPTGATGPTGPAASIANISGLQSALDGKQAVVTSTAVKTSAYGANPNELIPCDATSAGFTVTLPSAPADKARVIVKKIDTSTNAVTVACAGTDKFNLTSGATTRLLQIQSEAITTQYNSTLGVWYVIATDTPLTQLDTRFLAAGATAATATKLTNGAPRATTSIASSATPTINTDNCDFVDITALAAAITSMTTNLSGSPTNGSRLYMRIKDNGTTRAITWGTKWQSSGTATLLANTAAGKTHEMMFIYNSTAAKWVCVRVDATGY